ncbi:cupin domain-containing protein [Streptomyces lydicus]|uniref:cupin domain-containing protein n=1 Tax=Streptomyces lydicus TaxID=47763 RepID=UPI0037A00537
MADGHSDPSAASGDPVPRLLCDVKALAALDPAPAGARWRLAEPGRQLDANVVHIRPGESIDAHTDPDLDVLLLVVAGGGVLGATDGPVPLAEGSLLWLPRGSSRSLTAGGDGLAYMTVHPRRPGMRIRSHGTPRDRNRDEEQGRG